MQQDASSLTAQLAEKASRLTMNPGVYLMRDRQGSVIYVGKAKALRNRVRSYFQQLQSISPKTQLMVSKIADIETIATPTEKDALILENNLIKKYRPRFNIILRDDKEYPYLRLAVQELYPTLTIVRKPKKDGSRYYGPFPSAQAVRETVRAMHKLFPLRKCSGKRLQRKRPCIYHQFGQCPAPCCCEVDREAYQQTVREADLFLQGRNSDIIRELKHRMEHAAQGLEFELAARLRDRITAIEKTLEKQTQVCRDFLDRDIFALHRAEQHITVTVLFIRNCRMIGSRNFMLKQVHLSDEETLLSFISQYYHQGEFIPDEIIVPLQTEEYAVVGEWLRETRGTPVAIICPKRGFRRDFLDMAVNNAALAAARHQQVIGQAEDILRELQTRLHLRQIPERIACVDISNIMGRAAVGSLVMFWNGEPDRQRYRRFRIAAAQQPDDYGMMQEVLTRYLTRVQHEQALPDLVIVDGGKGQLNVLLHVLRDLDILTVDAAALAKGRARQQSGQARDETVFIPHRKNPVFFPKQSKSLLLLQHIRDEAHRFAVTYHKAVKAATDFSSLLEAVPGIGKKTAVKLLRHFGSIDGVRQAALMELCKVPSLSRKKAEALHGALQEWHWAGPPVNV